MKLVPSTAAVFSALVFVGVAGAQALVQPEIKERTITVSGVGSVKYRPEGAKISFGVRAADNVFGAAWKDNQTQAEKLRGGLEALKIDGLQVKVSTPDVMHNDNLGNGVIGPMGVPGGMNDKSFNVVRSFQVVVADKDFAQLHKNVLKVIETAMSHGANTSANLPRNNQEMFMGGGFPQGQSITRVEFYSSDDRTHRGKAYQKAVESALANAKGVAQGAQLQLGDVYSISDYQEMNVNFGLQMLEGPQQEVGGEVDLTVRVRVTFKF